VRLIFRYALQSGIYGNWSIFIYACVLSHLVLTGVPVVQQASWDEERVVLMAALAVVPAAVITDLCLSSG